MSEAPANPDTKTPIAAQAEFEEFMRKAARAIYQIEVLGAVLQLPPESDPRIVVETARARLAALPNVPNIPNHQRADER